MTKISAKDRAALLLQAVRGHFEEHRRVEAFETLVRAYYDEYTDAEELDAEHYRAFELIFALLFPESATAGGKTFEEMAKRPT